MVKGEVKVKEVKVETVPFYFMSLAQNVSL